MSARFVVEQKWNVMAHAQKPDLVFQRNGRVHLYRRGCQFSRLLEAEVCASAVVMLDRPCPIQCKTAGYPLHSPFSPLLLHPCVSVCHHIPFPLYQNAALVLYNFSLIFLYRYTCFACWELTNLIFCWPCIVIYPYKKNQQDALFTFNLFK